MSTRAHFLPFPSILHDQEKVLSVSLTIVYRSAVVEEVVDTIEAKGQ